MALGLAGVAAAAVPEKSGSVLPANTNAAPLAELPPNADVVLEAPSVAGASELQQQMAALVQTMQAEVVAEQTSAPALAGAEEAADLVATEASELVVNFNTSEAVAAPAAEPVLLAQAVVPAAAVPQAAAAEVSATAADTAAGAGATTAAAGAGAAAAISIPGAMLFGVAGLAIAAGDSVSKDSSPNVVRDTVAPTAPTLALASDTGSSASDKITKLGTVNVTGLETDATWEYSTNGGGSWSAGSGSSFVLSGDGVKSVIVRQTDAAGNLGASSTALSFTLDTGAVAPVVNTVATDNIVNATEKAAGVTVTGTAETGASVVVSWGTASKTVTATGGTWSTSFSSAEVPADASTTISAVATDMAGNVSAAGTRAVTVDTATTTPVINTVATDDVINAAERTATATVTGTKEAGSTVTLNGQATTALTDTTWSYVLDAAAIDAFGQGAETLTAVATDAAGNVNAVNGTKAINVDTVAPATPVINTVASDDVINAAERTATVTVTGTKEAGSTVTLNGQATTALTDTTWSYVLDAAAINAFGQGAETLTAVATDAAGNVNAANGTKAINVDTVAPVITLKTATGATGTVVLTYDGALDATNTALAGNFTVTTGGNPNAVTAVNLNGAVITLTVAPFAAGNMTVAYADPTAGDDLNAIQDAAGNDAGGFSSGIVADGYVRGATVYIDTNNNGTADPGTDYLVGTTDAFGSFFIPSGAPTGTIIAVGGVNIDTGVPNTLPLKAPAGATTINPLTTMVQAVVDQQIQTGATLSPELIASASTSVATSLGLTAELGGVSLSNYDPISSGSVVAQKAAAQVATIVTMAENASAGAGASVISGIVAQISAAGNAGGTVNLADSNTISAVVKGALSNATAEVQALAQSAISDASTAISTAVDLTGISTAQSQALDKTPPSAPTVAVSAGLTNSATPTVRVSFNTTASDGSGAVVGDTVKLLENGASISATVTLAAADIARGFVDLASNALGDGAHALSAQLVDKAGNASASATAAQLTVDTVAPVSPIINTVAGDDVVSSNEQAAALSGYAEAGSNVAMAIGGVTRVALAGTDGAWTYNLTATDMVNLGQGSQTISVSSTDAAGNTSAATTKAIAVDTEAPTLSASITGSNDNVTPVTGNIVSGGASNDNTPELSGTLSAALASGDVVAIYDDSIRLGLASVNGTAWTFTTAGLSNATHSFTARVEDAAGNAGASSTAYSVVVTADVPAATLTISSNSLTNSTTPALTGTIVGALADGEVIRVFDGGNFLGNAITVGNGWSFSPQSPLAQGVHNFSAVIENAGGNQGAVSSPVAVRIDTTAPAAPVIAAIAGENAVSGAEKEVGVAVSGNAEPGSSVLVTWGNASKTVAAGSGGAWTANFLSTDIPADGDTTVSATSTDAAGNVGAATSRLVKVDTTGPSVTVSAVAGDNAINSAEANATGGVAISGSTEAGAKVALSFSGGNVRNLVANGDGAWTYTLTKSDIVAMGQGAETLNVVARDASGNAGAAATQNITIDTLAPTLTPFGLDTASDTGVKGDGRSNVAAPTIVFNGESNASYAVEFINSAGVSTGFSEVVPTAVGAQLSLTAPAFVGGDGKYTVNLRAIDLAGNTTVRSGAYTLDTAVAVPTVNAIATDNIVNAAEKTAGVTVTGTAEAGASVLVSWGTASKTVSATGGTWSTSFSSADVPADASTTINAVSTDLAGNVSAAGTRAVTVDSQASAVIATITSATDNVPTTSPSTIAAGGTTNDNTPTLQGTLTAALGAGEVVAVYDGANRLGTASIDGTNWQFTTAGLTNGSHSFSTRVEDAAGNIGQSASPYAIDVQTLSLDAANKVLFVGNSATFGRADPVLSYNTYDAVTNPTGVKDLTAPIAGTSFANLTGSNLYEPHPWGGVAGLFDAFAQQLGIDYDVSMSTRNAATLLGHYSNTSPAGSTEKWDLRGNIASQKWEMVVLQDQTDEPLPSGTGSITFAAGSSVATLVIKPTADTAKEYDETISIRLAANANYQSGTTASLVGTISNDDPTGPIANPALPTVTLSTNPGAVLENGTGRLVYMFTRTGDTSADLVVNFSTARDGNSAPSVGNSSTDFEKISPTTGTATSIYLFESGSVATTGSASFGTSAAGGTGTITIKAGQTTATLTLSPTDDATQAATDSGSLYSGTTGGGDESLYIALTSNANYNVGTVGKVSATIINDDFVAGAGSSLPNITLALTSAAGVYENANGDLVYTFTRSGDAASQLTVNFDVTGTATYFASDATKSDFAVSTSGAAGYTLKTTGGANADIGAFQKYANLIEDYIHTGAADSTTISGTTIAANPNADVNTDVYLYQTWARPDMVVGNFDMLTNKVLDTASGGFTDGTITKSDTQGAGYYLRLEDMSADLAAAYNGLAVANPDFDGAAPVATAFMNAVLNGTAIRDPYTESAGNGKVNLWFDDNLHASKHGSYLAGLTLFGTMTGIDPRALGGGDKVASDLGIDSATALALQTVASATLGLNQSYIWSKPGTVTELGNGESATLATAGGFGFTDSASAVHTVSVVPGQGTLGTLAASIRSDGSTGQVNWLYTVNNQTIDPLLAFGQQRTETFTLLVNSGNGGTVSKTVTVNLLGTSTLQGTAGAESLVGSSGNDTILGLAGDDSIGGAAGDDLINGGDGSDWAGYTTATSAVTVNLTTNLATGGGGNDTLISIENVNGTSFDDIITGDAAANNLAGNNGDDSIIGGAGDDRLTGGAGADTLEGGVGTDRIRYASAGEMVGDVIHGNQAGSAADKTTLDRLQLFNAEAFDLSTALSITQIDRIDLAAPTLAGSTQTVKITQAIVATADGNGDGIAGDIRVTAYDGPSGLATLTNLVIDASALTSEQSVSVSSGGSNQGNDTMIGGAGNDTLEGGPGNDSIIGGAGNDYIRAGGNWSDGSDTINGGDGYDVVAYNFGGATQAINFVSTLQSGVQINPLGGTANLSGFETLHIFGGTLADNLTGDSGDNYIQGNEGNDTLTGGGGYDNFALNGAIQNGNDTITDFGVGGDQIAVQNIGVISLLTSGSVGTLGQGQLLVEVGASQTKVYLGADSVAGADASVTLQGSYLASGFSVSNDSFGGHITYTAVATPPTVSTATKIDWTSDQNGLGSVQGDDLFFQVHFTNPVLITGAPTLSLLITSASGPQTVQATFVPYTGMTPGSTQTSMQFKYTLQPGDTGQYHLGDLNLNGGSITEASWVGGLAADLTLNSSNKTITAGTYLFGAPVFGTIGTDGNDALLPYEADPAQAPINGTFTGVDGGAGNFDALVIPVLLPATVTTAAAAATYTLKYTVSTNTVTAVDANGSTVVTMTVPSSSAFPTGVEILAFHAVYNSGSGFEDADISGLTLSKSVFTVDDAVAPNEHYVQGSLGADDINLSADTSADARYLVRGGPGNDTITGSSGKDALIGEGGNDSINAGDGNDAIFVGSGTDTVDGGAGSDKVVATLGGQMLGIGSRIDGFALQSLTGTWGSNGFTTTATANVYRVLSADSGALTIRNFSDGTTAMTATNIEALEVRHSQSDVRTGIPLIFGDSDANTLIGTGTSIVNGAAGNDTLNASNNGNDVLVGGSGNDTLIGGSARDLLYGGLGDDSMAGNVGNDWFVGNQGNDTISGGDGQDSVGYVVVKSDGTASDRTALTYAWDSVANAVLVKQGANTLAKISAGPTADTITVQDLGNTASGGFGTDTLASIENLTFDFGDGVTPVLTIPSTQLTALFPSAPTDTSDQPIVAGQTINGSGTLTGGNGNDTLIGGLGNDTLNGGPGNDSLTGGDGDDYITAGGTWDGGSDTIDGGIGTDIAAYWYGNSSDVINFTSTGPTGTQVDPFGGVDTLIGIEEVHITGGNAADTFVGDTGRNWMQGGDGNDTLTGGGGLDTFSYTIASSNGVDTITDFGPNGDQIQLQNLSITGLNSTSSIGALSQGQVLVAAGASGTTLSIGADSVAGADLNIFLQGVFNSADFTWTNYSFGGAINYTPGVATTLASASSFTGGAGHDTITGSSGNDTIVGASGNDIIVGADGADRLAGGAGADTLVGGASDTTGDRIRYSGASDLIGDVVYGNDVSGSLDNASLDRIQLFNAENYDFGQAASITAIDRIDMAATPVTGGTLSQSITLTSAMVSTADANNDGTPGDIEVVGYDGSSTLSQQPVTTVNMRVDGSALISGQSLLVSGQDGSGRSGTNAFGGMNGNDTLIGGAGNDILKGGVGNDQLAGGDGNDFLFGGSGSDSFLGGAGNDTFVYTNVNQSTATAADRVGDFAQGDKIDLAAILGAVTGGAGYTSTSGIGAAKSLQIVTDTGTLGAVGDNQLHMVVNYSEQLQGTRLEIKYDTNSAVGAPVESSSIVIDFQGDVSSLLPAALTYI